jgi:transcriptional regulator with XRE-family HTH domain
MKPVNNLNHIKIGQNLKRLRKQSKLTQSNVAAVLGVSYQQIQKFESGINRIFAHQLIDICDEFNWNLTEFRASESSVSDSNN